jgi:hypothetical protein
MKKWGRTPFFLVMLAGSAALAADPCPPQQPVDPNRQRPGAVTQEFEPVPCNPEALPPPRAVDLRDFDGYPDRWRLVTALGYPEDLWNPYRGNNWLKGDRPSFGEDWFTALLAISDTVVEPRRFPVPVGSAVTDDAGSLDLVGDGEQLVLAQTVLVEGIVYQGNTVFRPPDWEFRAIPALNFNRVEAEERGFLRAPADSSKTRNDNVLTLQALFVDKHLRDVSPRYDFDSVRVGIQPFTADFRGFLFQDSAFGVRLFGIRDNNRWQYNLAWFRRIDKDINSGLNDLTGGGLGLRDDDVFVANLYRQDFPVLGFTSQLTAVYNRNREDGELLYDDNGFIQRPASLGLERGRDYDVVYLGYNGDGHFGPWNLTVSTYAALGEESRGTFTDRTSDIRAWFLAAEGSRDFSWIRPRVSFLYASGDRDPYDDRATGFDAIFENPLFAGADTSFWVRQPVPLIGGGRVGLSARNGVLNSLRPSKELGQSNFTNPGTVLLGIGADLDLTPTLRLSVNANELWFARPQVVEAARAQAGINRHLGLDLSASLIWRPLAIQNIVFRLSTAVLLPGSGYEDLFGNKTAYSVLGNMVLTY